MAASTVKVSSVRLWDEVRDGLHLSDHYPVEVCVELGRIETGFSHKIMPPED